VLAEEAAKAMKTGVELGEVIDLSKERKPEPPKVPQDSQIDPLDPNNSLDPNNPQDPLLQK
jgi:hypothetical protein